MAVLDTLLRPFGLISARTAQEQTIIAEKQAEERAEERAITSGLTNPSQWFSDWMGGTTSAGVHVNAETAIKISAVYACIRILSTTIGSLSCSLYRNLPNGDIEEATDIPEYDIVCVEPNSLYSSYTWNSTTMEHESLRGNSYTRLYFGRSGRISKMEILHPDFTTPFLSGGNLFYRSVDIYGQQIILSDYEVLHFKNLSDDGLIGRSPISVGSDVLGQAIAQQKYASNAYKNGGGLKGLLITDNSLTEKQIEQTRHAVMTVMQDYERTASVGIIGGGMKWQQVGMSPRDAEYIAASNLSILDICRLYGIPPHMVAKMDNATFSNIEHQSIELVTSTIRPIVKNREQEMNRRILRKSDRGTLFFRYNLDSLLRGDSKARAEYISKMLAWGVYNIDEARSLDNLNQLPDGLGKKHYIPANMIEVGKQPDPTQLDNNIPASTGQPDTADGIPQE
jgi:HK97 family phage portal protein